MAIITEERFSEVFDRDSEENPPHPAIRESTSKQARKAAGVCFTLLLLRLHPFHVHFGWRQTLLPVSVRRKSHVLLQAWIHRQIPVSYESLHLHWLSRLPP